MKTIVFPKSEPGCYGCPVIVDSNNLEIVNLKQTRSYIDHVYVSPCDCEVRYYEGTKAITLKANKGDIIITFSKWADNLKHRVIVVKNKEWKENIANIEAEEAADRARDEIACSYCKCEGDCESC